MENPRRESGIARIRAGMVPAYGLGMTLIWFVVWLIADNVGGREPLLFDPVNGWTATLILAVALDLGRSGVLPRSKV